MKTLLALFALTTSLLAAPQIGQPAPDFSVADTQGKTHRLADYKGKFVVLEWTNFGCPFVRKHYDSGNMQSLQKTYTGKGVVWLTVSSSAPGHQGHLSPEQWAKAEQEKGAAPTAVLTDADGKVGHAYDAKTTPHMFVIDPAGKLIYDGGIDDQPTPDPSSLAGANNYVKAALDEAMTGKPVTTPMSRPYGCSVKY